MPALADGGRLTPDAPGARGSGVFSGALRRHGLWVLRRLGYGVLTLFVVSIIIFLAINALPTNAAAAILGPTATHARVHAVVVQLGLDKPLVDQYLSWIGHTLSGNFGHSLVQSSSVASIVGPRIVNSAVLVFISAVIVIPLAFAVGMYSASQQGRAVDQGFNVGTMFSASIPDFVIGIFLVIIFATTLFHILPAVSLVAPGASPLATPNELILPVATLVLSIFPYLSRLVRGSMIDALDSEYVQLARLKGIPERLVVVRHAIRNAIVPGIQGSSLSLAYLLGGVVAVETIYSYPGLGTGLVNAVSTADVPTIQAIVLIFAAGYVIFNIIADILTVYATPRLRTQ